MSGEQDLVLLQIFDQITIASGLDEEDPVSEA